ncbi:MULTISPECIES: HlyD family secretion protein [unclassified Luteimonas]
MSGDLFRKEALDAKRAGWLGGISLAQPTRLWMLTLAAVVSGLVVALFLTLGTYTRRSTVTGQLVSAKGLASVLAPSTGVVSTLDVAEGTRVREGQRLAVVTVPRATVAGGDTLAALEQRLERRLEGLADGQDAQRELLGVQASGFRAQLAVARSELTQIEAEIDTRREQIRIADETLQRLRQLEDERYVSLLQINQQESNALSWRGEMQGLERQAISARRTIAQLQHALRELPGQTRANEAGHVRDLALLEQEQLETQTRGALAVTAPVDGVVSSQLVKQGQAVQAGQSLLSVLPGDEGLEAELLVPSRAIGFIEPGDRVLLRYQAYPYQKFGHHEGEVARISRSALNSGELGALLGNAQASEPLYRITVTLARQAVTAYGNDEALKPGMLVDADIMGERRRLIEWIFEPLYSLKGRVGA